MSILWAKVRGDLRLRPDRFLLMAVAVTVGTAALAAALIAQSVLGHAIPASFDSSLPPDAILATGDSTEEALALLSDVPGVLVVEPRRVMRGRIETPKGFASLSLTILPDLAAQEVSRIATNTPDASGLIIERSSIDVWGGEPGDTATLRLLGAGEVTLPTGGTATDAAVAPGVQDRIVYAYATPAMVGVLSRFDELRLRLEPDALPDVLARLETAGIVPQRIEEPLRRHPHADQMQAVMGLLTVFAAAAVAVGAALVANLVAVALRAEQRLIGIQKAIGASARRVVLTVLAGVAQVVVPGAVVGLAVGLVGAGQFLTFAAHELNLADQSLAPSATVLVAALVTGILVPLAASWIIARRAARVAPLAAISADRETRTTRRPRRSATSVARAYATRHLGRAPVRLALMLLALSLGGAAVLTAGTVYRSLSGAVDRVFEYRADDIDLRLLIPAPVADLEASVQAVGVERAEVWGFLLTAFETGDRETTGTRFGLLAPPADTALLSLPMAEGRWLGDPEAVEIVAARSLLARYPDLAVGSEVTLARGDARVTALIVGAIEEATEPGVYATASVHDALAGQPGLAGALRLATSSGPAEVAARVEDRLFETGHVPILVFDRAEVQQATKAHFAILLVLLSTIGAAALTVGGLALWSSITVAILERQREVAVIRALGAANGRVMRLFGGESAGLAVIALALSVAIALPLSAALAGMLGQGTLFVAVPLRFSWTALAIWVFVLVAIVTLATWTPLRRALAVPPASGLRYE